MPLVERFVRNPTKVIVAVLLLILFGGIASVRMPIQLTPEVQSPVISVETRWPGASPQEVERELTHEQEEQLKGLEGMVTMTSESMDSESTIRLEMEVGTNMPEALLRVNTRLQQVREYPEDAEQPVIRTRDLSRRSIGIFVLRPYIATDEDIIAFQGAHPSLAKKLRPARIAYNSGLRLKRLRKLAEQHPEVKQLLPRDIDMTTMRRFTENVVEARLERVNGVGDARVLGGRYEELQVIVDPQKLAARGLTLVDMRSVLQTENEDRSGGDFWEGKRRYVVRTRGRFRDLESVRDVMFPWRDGAPVYIRDVAEVRLGYRKPDGLALRIGTTSLTLMCSRQTGANTLDVMKGLRAAVDELNNGILREKGLSLEQVYDETDYIYSAIGLVRQNIFVGGTFTVIILLLFLRSARSTFVVGIAIPVCIIGTFLILYLLGRSLNVISLAGLAFAVGMLVDNAVVVLENIYRHYQNGEHALTATVRGTQEVWGAVAASTLTTLAVFLPVLFIQEEAGQLFRDIALAISSAVALSLVISVILIPTSAAKLLRRKQQSPETSRRINPVSDTGVIRVEPAHFAASRDEDRPVARQRIQRIQLGFLDRLGRNFSELVVGVNSRLQNSLPLRMAIVVSLVGGAITLSWLLIPNVEYLPTGNRNLVFGSLSLPPGYNLSQIEEIGKRIEEGLRPYWDLDIGSEEERQLKYPPIADFFFIARGREVFMGTRAEDPMRGSELVPLIRELTAGIPGAIGGARQSSLFSRSRGSGRSVEIEITGPETENLVVLGAEVMQRLQAVMPGSQARPIPSLDLSSPEVHVLPKRENASGMLMSAGDIGFTVDALVDGARVGDYYLDADKIDLKVIGQERFANRTDELESLPIATPTGQVVPLGSIADVVLSSGPEQINHSERQRAIRVDVQPPASVPLGEAMELVRAEIIQPMTAEGKLGGEYFAGLTGTADQLAHTWRALRWNFALAVVITYLLMAALFESWMYPVVIILSVPLGAVGGILGLNVLNVYLSATGQSVQHLDVLTMLGFVILIGTVVNNAILIVHHSLNLMRDGYARNQAVLESVRTRIRPIFMTTSTTVLGLMPLVLFPGAGAELYRGLGSVVLGGLVVSTVFTLVLVPTLFTLMFDGQARLARLIFGSPAPFAVEEPIIPSAARSHRPVEGIEHIDHEATTPSN